MHLIRMKPYNKALGDVVRSYSYKRNRFFAGIDKQTPSILYVVKDNYIAEKCLESTQEGQQPWRPIFEEIFLAEGQTLGDWIQEDFEDRVTLGWPSERTKVQGDQDLIKELNNGESLVLPKPKHQIYKKEAPQKRYRSTKKRSLVADTAKE